MPTGYTSILDERPDVTFREFALRCARGMGACVMQRDEPLGDPPKVPEPSDYYELEKRLAAGRLAEIRGLSQEATRALWQADCESIAKANADSVAKCSELERRYTEMRQKASAWVAPTSEHEGLRRFMLEQIDACGGDWTPYEQTPAPTPGDWLAKQIERAEWRLRYATEHAAAELVRHAERRRWIEALYESLPEHAVADGRVKT